MSLLRRLAVLPFVSLCFVIAGCSSEIKVGAIISQSGAVATYGMQVKKGLDLALEEINAEGAIKGKTIQLIYMDDATNPDVGEKVVQELIHEQKVKLIIGAISSKVTLRIAPICEEAGVILLSPSSSAPSISQAGDYIFRNYPSDILEGTSMAVFAKEQGLQRVVIFALDNAFGAGLKEVFTQQYESKFRSVVRVFDIPEAQTSGFEEIVAEAADLNPDGIYLITYDTELPELLRQIDAAGLDSMLLGTSSIPSSIGRTAGAVAEKLVYPQPAYNPNSTDVAVSDFVQAYKAKYDEEPEIYAAHGYDALKLLVAAINEMGGRAHPANIMLGLGTIKDYSGAAGRTSFDENGDVVRYPRLFIVNEGASVSYQKFVDEGGSLFDASD